MRLQAESIYSRKERKERENTLLLPTLLRAFNQMDIASRACTLSLTIGATLVNILSASISKIQNFIFSIQACLKVTFHVRTHVRGANVVHLMKIIMDRSALREGLGEREVQNKNLTNNLRLEPSPENLSFAQLNLIFYPLPWRGYNNKHYKLKSISSSFFFAHLIICEATSAVIGTQITIAILPISADAVSVTT